ncbi:hypothetical protein B7C42_07622 [Nocardia cerradoensis]|uniref:Transposase n=1 Tax=Nocardia cerradoensis TaxID=85688 RepID=A0A231GUH7_9NOCA|nr:DUF6262 family protein [Nocardia cerradoensis]OXR40284.1 hypothetical protein B7C42_07622 [Nocardia cerradoensis]
MPPADNTRFLLEATQRRSVEARTRAEAAIATAARSRGRVTVAAIAKTAKVSRSWIYTQSDLVEAISVLQQRNPASGHPARASASTESLQTRLAAATERNKQLRRQLAQLTEQLETAYGEIRALRNAQPH